MRFPLRTNIVILLALLIGLIAPLAASMLPAPAQAAPLADVSAYELIAAMNSLRVSNGLPALIEDPIVNAVAQSTAETMAASQMSWHIGNAAGRIQSAGYGGGAKVWATENFATGNYGIDEIMVIWSDASHMIPAVNPAYCHVGAGVARSSNGRNYYVLQAAYTATNSCGPYKPVTGGNSGGSGSNPGGVSGVSQLIVAVKVADPDADGKIFHEVKSGQSLWAIAVAYKVTIRDIETWNNITKETPLKVGQKLFIPGSNTEGYATPTPVGMVRVNEADAEGKIYHIVQPYEALYSIAQAYKVSVDNIVALNAIMMDTPLQIDQKLLIRIGSQTPSPSQAQLSPIQMLTPDIDGRYYHTVKSGETLSGIANLYAVNLNELMTWNGLDGASILYPNQKLALLVTPPPTSTPEPSPTALAQVIVDSAPTGAGALIATHTPLAPVAAAQPAASSRDWMVGSMLIGTATAGLLLFIFSVRKKR